MPSVLGKTWKQKWLVEINLILTNLQAIVPETDSAANSADTAAGEAVVVETATSEDAEEDHQPNQSPQSERRRQEAADAAVVNQSAGKEEEAPGEAPETEDEPPALHDEAHRVETHKGAGGNKAAAEARDEKDRRALLDIKEAREAPVPETVDPERLTQKLPLWIMGANAKKQLRKRVNWG